MPSLLRNASASGVPIDWTGNREGSIQVWGVWDGATITIEGSLDGGVNFASCEGATFNRDMITSFAIANSKIRAIIQNAGASTSLNCEVSPG